jgi:hypothetical protein
MDRILVFFKRLYAHHINSNSSIISPSLRQNKKPKKNKTKILLLQKIGREQDENDGRHRPQKNREGKKHTHKSKRKTKTSKGKKETLLLQMK